jgi:very-short-patch-repair endonuclease
MTRHENETSDYRQAKRLRREAPLAERLVWNKLCETARPAGLKFRRQYPLHPYVADLVCLKARLVVELDGDSHDARQGYDGARSAFLEKSGFQVLRFTNEEAKQNLEGVIATIIRESLLRVAHNSGHREESDAPSPNPSRKGRGTLPVEPIEDSHA